MKKKNISRLTFISLVCALVFTGCDSTGIQILPTSSGTVVVDSEMARTSTPTVLATLIPERTVTRQPPLLTPTHATTLTATVPVLTPLPTLPPDQAKQTIFDLFHTNGNCDFPCWWGIEPGETSWAEAENFLTSLGLEVGSIDYPGYTLHGFRGLDIEEIPIHNRFTISDESGVVQEIHLYGEGFSDPEKFMALWNEYSPRSLLSNYGLPTRIYLEIINMEGYGNSGTNPYNLTLLYDYDGIAVRFTGLTQFQDPLSICPDFEVGDSLPEINVLFKTPNREITDLEMVDWIGFQPQHALPIEEATELSKTEFVELLIQSSEPACFSTPLGIWKSP